MGAPRKGSANRQELGEHLTELALLADTAGAEVVGELTQQLDRPNAGTYLGTGKVAELADLVNDARASLVIFDDELTPSQGKNIEDAVGKRVVDRAELILDIFASRARSNEAKMQVELAQLEYMLPRLTRMWTHLERYAGGMIGARGPGETQLETDRRLVNHRIKLLKERLEEVQRSREVQRSSRAGHFKASLVGYTNAGKSSILRGLSGTDVHVENRLFATLDPLTREIDLGDVGTVLVTDTVGFIRKLPHHLVASFRATLEEVKEADLLLHVVDASHPAWEEHRQVVEQVLQELGATDAPRLLVVNKTDLLPEEELHALQERLQRLAPNSVFVSAVAEHGLEPLHRALAAAVRARKPLTEINISVSDGKLLSEIHQYGEVIDQRTLGDRLIVRAHLPEKLAGRLKQAGARLRVE